MRRYDERRTLAAKLERGELKRREVVASARVLARFHAHALRVATSVVPALAVERRMTENFHELLAIAEQRAEIEWVLALERFAHAFVVAHTHMLDARARGGLVREVHGDLRAEHVLLEETVQVVDCIEFDRGLREIDTADDLAFLVMDLVASGAERFARMLVRAYRHAGGDPGEDRLIAFYAAYRALVRAKVALLRAAQHPASSSEHGRESAATRNLLALAERFAWQARLPLVVVICGVPAAGKSHLAQALAEVSRLPHLSSDVTRKRLAGIGSQKRAGDRIYSTDFNRMTYAELGRRAAGTAAACGGALVDATIPPPCRPRGLRRRVRRRGAVAVRRVPGAHARARGAGSATRPPANTRLGCVAVGRDARELGLGAAGRAGARGARDAAQRPARRGAA
jgi:uncharacterized protein